MFTGFLPMCADTVYDTIDFPTRYPLQATSPLLGSLVLLLGNSTATSSLNMRVTLRRLRNLRRPIPQDQRFIALVSLTADVHLVVRMLLLSPEVYLGASEPQSEAPFRLTVM
jgi:hypothetical protein